jgi:hypothetical protein
MEDMLRLSTLTWMPKKRTLVSVQYALEGTMKKHIELTQVTPIEIPQHACVRPPK